MRWFTKVKVGDILKPDPFWNKTERQGNQLPAKVEVLRVIKATSQSGVLFTVRTNNLQERNLDAAWFMPNAKVNGE